jgi:putative aldouronate transport system substrate-binding protein
MIGYGMTGLFSGMYGLPNQWSVDRNGKLTNVLEMPAFRDAINAARTLWAAGVYSPKSTEYIGASGRTGFMARKFVYLYDAFREASLTFFSTVDNLDPPGRYRLVAPFAAAADMKPTYWAGAPGTPAGAAGFSVLKKGSPERIKELLRVLNWIASPFGSEEYLMMQYGVKDLDYKPDDRGNPVLTEQGKIDTGIPWRQITAAPTALYLQGHPQYAQVMQSAEKAMLPVAQIDPTSTLYSETFAAKGRVLNRMLSDGVGEVVLGRAPLSSIDRLISDWRAQGGDQMRAEFEEAIAAASS